MFSRPHKHEEKVTDNSDTESSVPKLCHCTRYKVVTALLAQQSGNVELFTAVEMRRSYYQK